MKLIPQSVLLIRYVPLGLVCLTGRAHTDQLTRSPISRQLCCLYRVGIDEWRPSVSPYACGGDWITFCTDVGGHRFYLRDDNGTVPIDAHLAKYELPLTTEREVNLDLLRYIRHAQAHAFTDAAAQLLPQLAPRSTETMSGSNELIPAQRRSVETARCNIE